MHYCYQRRLERNEIDVISMVCAWMIANGEITRYSLKHTLPSKPEMVRYRAELLGFPIAMTQRSSLKGRPRTVGGNKTVLTTPFWTAQTVAGTWSFGILCVRSAMVHDDRIARDLAMFKLALHDAVDA